MQTILHESLKWIYFCQYQLTSVENVLCKSVSFTSMTVYFVLVVLDGQSTFV